MATLRRYVSGADVGAAEAASALRVAFAVLFMAQTSIALLVALVVVWATDAPGGTSSSLGIVLVILAMVQGPAGVAAGVAPLPEPEKARTAAVHRTLLAAVLLSTPAWYLAFMLATRNAGWPVLALLALLVLYWIVGVLLATRLGARAAES